MSEHYCGECKYFEDLEYDKLGLCSKHGGEFVSSYDEACKDFKPVRRRRKNE